MKNGFTVSILVAIIAYLLISDVTTLKIIGTIIALLFLIYLFLEQAIIYNYYQTKISNFKEDVSVPFVNVNKVSWKILMLIPNIDKITAKHIVHNRRHFGNYKSLDDFFGVNKISIDKREQIKKYIVVK